MSKGTSGSNRNPRRFRRDVAHLGLGATAIAGLATPFATVAGAQELVPDDVTAVIEESSAISQTQRIELVPGETVQGEEGVRTQFTPSAVPGTFAEAVDMGLITVQAADPAENADIETQLTQARRIVDQYNDGINPFGSGPITQEVADLVNQSVDRVNELADIRNAELAKDPRSDREGALARVQGSTLETNAASAASSDDFNRRMVTAEALNAASDKQFAEATEANRKENIKSFETLITDSKGLRDQLTTIKSDFPDLEEEVNDALLKLDALDDYAKSALDQLKNGRDLETDGAAQLVEDLNGALVTINGDRSIDPGLLASSPNVDMAPVDKSAAPFDRPDMGVSPELKEAFAQFLKDYTAGQPTSPVVGYLQNVGGSGIAAGNEEAVSIWVGVDDPRIKDALKLMDPNHPLLTNAYLGTAKDDGFLDPEIWPNGVVGDLTPEIVVNYLNNNFPLSTDGSMVWNKNDVLEASTHVYVDFILKTGETLEVPFADVRGAELTSGRITAKELNRFVIDDASFTEFLDRASAQLGRKLTAEEILSLGFDTRSTVPFAHSSLKADGTAITDREPVGPLNLKLKVGQVKPEPTPFPSVKINGPTKEMVVIHRQLGHVPRVEFRREPGYPWLPRTGGNILPIVLAGSACIAGGAVVLRTRRNHLYSRDSNGSQLAGLLATPSVAPTPTSSVALTSRTNGGQTRGNLFAARVERAAKNAHDVANDALDSLGLAAPQLRVQPATVRGL